MYNSTKHDCLLGVYLKDASGGEDCGNIDSLLTLYDGYRIEGDWGSVRIWSSAPPSLHPISRCDAADD